MGLILSKTKSFEMKEFPSEPRIPPMYFKKHDDPNFVNGKDCVVYAMTEPAKGSENGSLQWFPCSTVFLSCLLFICLSNFCVLC